MTSSPECVTESLIFRTSDICRLQPLRDTPATAMIVTGPARPNLSMPTAQMIRWAYRRASPKHESALPRAVVQRKARVQPVVIFGG